MTDRARELLERAQVELSFNHSMNGRDLAVEIREYLSPKFENIDTSEEHVRESDMKTHILPAHNQRYRHKNGKIYCVLEIGKMESTQETVVIYREWGSNKNPVWVRPLSEWWSRFGVLA